MASTMSRTIERARIEAVKEGARTIEAEHLLLALSREPDAVAALERAGWDEEGLRRALQEEWVAGLASAGVDQEIPAPGTPDLAATPRVGESVKQALVRGVTTSKLYRSRKVQGVHLLHGVITATHGTVPRALTPAGVAALQQRLERSF